MTRGAPGAIRKRSVTIAGHRTSVSLEAAFWEALAEIAGTRDMSVRALIGRIDAERADQNLSSAIRVHVLTYIKSQLGSKTATD